MRKKIISSLIVLGLVFNFILFPEQDAFAGVTESENVMQEIKENFPSDVLQYMQEKSAIILKDAKELANEFDILLSDFAGGYWKSAFSCMHIGNFRRVAA